MKALPDSVRQAWEDRDGPVILATVSSAGVPNIIYANCVGAFGDDRLVVADIGPDRLVGALSPNTASRMMQEIEDYANV